MTMEFKFDDRHRELLDLISASGKALNAPVYLVGGYVRDRLLDIDDSQDLDIVAVGSGIDVATDLAASDSPLNPRSSFTRSSEPRWSNTTV